MVPWTTDLVEIITHDRLGNYYLKEIIPTRARSLAPSPPTSAQLKNPFFCCRLHISASLQVFKKKKTVLPTYIRSEQNEHFILVLVFRVHQKERSLQKNEKLGRPSFKKKKS